MKITITEMKKFTRGLNRFEQAEKRITLVEDRSIMIIQPEEQKNKRAKE